MYDVDSDWQSWPGETPVTVRCERCGTERRDRVASIDGKLMGRRYVYPEGYRYGKGERPTANEFRLQLIGLRLKEAKGAKAAAKAAGNRKAALTVVRDHSA